MQTEVIERTTEAIKEAASDLVASVAPSDHFVVECQGCAQRVVVVDTEEGSPREAMIEEVFRLIEHATFDHGGTWPVIKYEVAAVVQCKQAEWT